MAVHKLYIEDFDEIDYELIAIHTTIEDYHLAYLLNQNLPVLFAKSDNDIQVNTKEGVAHFPLFVYECPIHGAFWSLMGNQGDIPSHAFGEGLFTAPNLGVATRVYLLPEFKKVNFFVKIEAPTSTLDEIIKSINTIDKISTVYSVETDKIKSINNLIF